MEVIVVNEFHLKWGVVWVGRVVKCMESVGPVFSTIRGAYFFVRGDVTGGSNVDFVFVLGNDCIVTVEIGCIIGVSSPAGEWMKCVNNSSGVVIGPDIVISRGDVRKRELVKA